MAAARRGAERVVREYLDDPPPRAEDKVAVAAFILAEILGRTATSTGSSS